ncbi:hypothetical protein BpHYR1_041292 [Brachionus plicatilis]|uniref:Uncharacterized protein n=1 Tax=Brachionus plicatilis TaxID=10195 RepID=A0A3M7PS50_BRAPC|nr:hypothetical protein BpHYR1_041292 [Brachionus plicatilis]
MEIKTGDLKIIVAYYKNDYWVVGHFSFLLLRSMYFFLRLNIGFHLTALFALIIYSSFSNK